VHKLCLQSTWPAMRCVLFLLEISPPWLKHSVRVTTSLLLSAN
jgi:hypothetical protein